MDEFSAFEREGRLWFRNALSDADLQMLDAHAHREDRPGARVGPCENLHRILGAGGRIQSLVDRVLRNAMPVRAIAFNKSQQSNWGVPWHQDRVIAVKERADVQDFQAWKCQRGVWSCEPTLPLLMRMVFARIHLDDTDEKNGCLEIALGSHLLGKIAARAAATIARSLPKETCAARRGDVLVLKMLMLHRSSAAQSKGQRRVYRIDYAADVLPHPLRWAW